MFAIYFTIYFYFDTLSQNAQHNRQHAEANILADEQDQITLQKIKQNIAGSGSSENTDENWSDMNIRGWKACDSSKMIYHIKYKGS